MANEIIKAADKLAKKQSNRKARELRKALKGNATVVVTTYIGSIYTMVQAESDKGLRFSGLINGRPGRFHAMAIKSIQTFEQTKEGENG